MVQSTDTGGPARLDVWSFNCSGGGDGDLPGAHLDDMALTQKLGRTLSPRVADLIEMAAAVHLVDRATKRPTATRAGEAWSRHLRLRIGVRDTKSWDDEGKRVELTRFLRRLTDDTWQFEFVERVAPARPAECISFLFDTPAGADLVALYSGGLDSIAGLLLDVEAGAHPLLMSVGTNPRLIKSQNETLALLRRDCAVNSPRVPVALHLTRMRAPESTQRARGFGFLALAAATAALAGLTDVHVYENGIGAINLPYTAAQAGTQATKAMTPDTLRRASSLFSSVLDHEIRVADPCMLATKAEMCRRMPAAARDAIVASKSCDTAFAHRSSAASHSCGACTSCILRRQALHASGLGDLDDVGEYRIDAFDGGEAGGDHYVLSAMLSQVSHLSRALDQPDPWLGLVRAFPDLASFTASQAGVPDTSELVSLFRRYVAEWSAVPTELLGRYVSPTNSSAA